MAPSQDNDGSAVAMHNLLYPTTTPRDPAAVTDETPDFGLIPTAVGGPVRIGGSKDDKKNKKSIFRSGSKNINFVQFR